MMTPGKVVRRVLGPRYFSVVGAAYRRVFVDLQSVAAAIGRLPSGAEILDIGGGDGSLLNLLLAQNPDVHVTMIDPSPNLGSALAPQFQSQVLQLPNTTLSGYKNGSWPTPDVILISDVIHHVLPNERYAFFSDVKDVLSGSACQLFLKDMQPGHFRTLLGGLADRYVSGDRNVQFMSSAGVTELIRQVFDDVDHTDTELFRKDCPNYCVRFRLNWTQAASAAGNPQQKKDS